MFELEAKEVNPEEYLSDTDEHGYISDLSAVKEHDAKKFINVGVDIAETGRAGTFIQMDKSVIHCKTCQPGVEMMSITEAEKHYDRIGDYLWKGVSPDKDQFTANVKKKLHNGYFIRTLPGVKVEHPLQSCLYIAKNNFSQNVHNIVIAEEGSELHIITGCATSPLPVS